MTTNFIVTIIYMTYCTHIDTIFFVKMRSWCTLCCTANTCMCYSLFKVYRSLWCIQINSSQGWCIGIVERMDPQLSKSSNCLFRRYTQYLIDTLDLHVYNTAITSFILCFSFCLFLSCSCEMILNVFAIGGECYV